MTDETKAALIKHFTSTVDNNWDSALKNSIDKPHPNWMRSLIDSWSTSGVVAVAIEALALKAERQEREIDHLRLEAAGLHVPQRPERPKLTAIGERQI